VVVVAVSGPHGAGKTTVARFLAKKLGLRYLSAGELFRRMAAERGMSLEEFSRYAEKNVKIDEEIDRRTVEEARRGNVLVDARLAGWLLNDADLKILLTAPLEVRVRRIAEREGRPYEEVLRETVKRERSEERRFKKFYGIDLSDLSPFDIVLNTERISIEEMRKISLAAARVMLGGGRK